MRNASRKYKTSKKYGKTTKFLYFTFRKGCHKKWLRKKNGFNLVKVI